MYIKKLKTGFISGLLFLFIQHVYAAGQVVEVSSDSLLLEENEGVATYEGNVLFKKDNLVIKADSITVYQEAGKISKAIITGNPAMVNHKPKNEAPADAQAEHIEYIAASDLLLLTGNALVTRGTQQFSGEKIKYDANEKTLSASGQKTIVKTQEQKPNQKPELKPEQKPEQKPESGRVHVIIGPTDKPAETDKDQ